MYVIKGRRDQCNLNEILSSTLVRTEMLSHSGDFDQRS
jgi:hypothetical protein